MLNIEYYKDKLVELGVINFDKLAVIEEQPRICNTGILCDECLLNNKNEFCSNEALNWLFSEYEEPEVDWSKVEVDTPILVTDYVRSKWVKRYFAKFEDGKVYAWQDGATSWSVANEYDVTCWNYAKLVGSEE